MYVGRWGLKYFLMNEMNKNTKFVFQLGFSATLGKFDAGDKFSFGREPVLPALNCFYLLANLIQKVIMHSLHALTVKTQ